MKTYLYVLSVAWAVIAVIALLAGIVHNDASEAGFGAASLGVSMLFDIRAELER